jgi:hypothetical protein
MQLSAVAPNKELSARNVVLTHTSLGVTCPLRHQIKPTLYKADCTG